MFGTQPQLRPRPARRHRVPYGGARSPSPTRAPSLAAFSVSVARSSRSSSSSVAGDRHSVADTVKLPLTLYEYGFDVRALPDLTVNPTFPDAAGVEFLNSQAGRQLRALETEHSRTVTQYVRRAVQLAGKRLLVLGSGSSRSLVSLLGRGALSAVCVDTSSSSLSVLRGRVAEAGVDATVDVEYVCGDAWEYLSSLDEREFDLVLAFKCVGAILSSGPNRTAPALLDLVADVLRPNGSFISDHHQAFSGQSAIGKPIGTGLSEPDFALATVGGRYAADLGFSWDLDHPDLSLVTRFSSLPTPSLIQTWHTFHFRFRAWRSTRPAGGVARPRVQRAPGQITRPPSQPFDAVADAMVPVNNRGVKRIPEQSDLRAVDVTLLRPKFDGVACIVAVSDQVAAVISPVLTFAVPLPVSVSPPMVVTGEVIESVEGHTGVAVTGVVSVGDVRADPNDPMALASVTRVIDQLLPAGFFPNLPTLMKQVRGNTVVLPGPSGRVSTFPVDGVNATCGGESGSFFKPANLYTIDAKPSDIADRVADAGRALGVAAPMKVETGSGEGVLEYSYDNVSSTWRPVRARLDKTYSDTPGSVIHTVSAALTAYHLGLVGTVEEVVKLLTV